MYIYIHVCVYTHKFKGTAFHRKLSSQKLTHLYCAAMEHLSVLTQGTADLSVGSCIVVKGENTVLYSQGQPFSFHESKCLLQHSETHSAVRTDTLLISPLINIVLR